MLKAPVGLGKPDLQARRIERKACGRQRRSQKGERVGGHQHAKRQHPFSGEKRAGTLGQQFDVLPFAGTQMHRHRMLCKQKLQRGIGKCLGFIANEQKHRNMPLSGAGEGVGSKGRKQDGGCACWMMDGGRSVRHRKNAHEIPTFMIIGISMRVLCR